MCQESSSHASAKSKLKSIALISAIFMIIEITGGYFANSIAIMADAFHLLSDVLAYMISLYAIILSSRPASNYYPFGYEKAQPLGALLNVILIWIVTIGLLKEATNRILARQIVEQPFYMLLTSIFGLGCNLYIMKVLHSSPQSGQTCNHDHHKNQKLKFGSHSINYQQKKRNYIIFEIQQQLKHLDQTQEIVKSTKQIENCESPTKKNLKQIQLKEHNNVKVFEDINIEAAYIHILSDIILSIGVILSASLIYFFSTEKQWTYWQLADPLCTYFFSVVAIWSTFPIVKESIIILLDGCTDTDLISTIEKELQQKCITASDIKLWTINRGKNYATLKISNPCNQLFQVKQIFKKHQIEVIIGTMTTKIL